ncbi:MAG: YiiX/YebB-like N1pC/P60 family cysteine hydrolase [Myxococcota bacterium]
MSESGPRSHPRPWLRRAKRIGLGLLVSWGLLSIPALPVELPDGAGATPFVWDRDDLWSHLERKRDEVVAAGCQQGSASYLVALNEQLDALEREAPGPADTRWDSLEMRLFETAAIVAACGDGLEPLLSFRQRLRRSVKDASAAWSDDDGGRDRLYRLLYGARAAIEEVLLQVDASPSLALEVDPPAPFATPSTTIEGVVIHSGDLLLSRGGAPTSALIARGSDHPGNFSHVALVAVDESGQARAIEAHIERGVAVSDVDAYFADKKLRVVVLRLRADHPALVADPMLPHRAASAALAEVRSRHIPYDFSMDFEDDAEQFCSEVASAAYRDQGVELWQHMSTFSSPGLTRWLASLGVEHFRTHGPSDLEYDPQLRVVAEWHEPQTLFDDHVDNAVIDAMLEQAEAGGELHYSLPMLPIARLVKGYSVLLNLLLGAEGPIPEGMSATTGLRVQWLAAEHARIERGVMSRMDDYRHEHGRRPPYWTLVTMAREAAVAAP